jgi:CDP-glucose 4,6-dehydratase
MENLDLIFGGAFLGRRVLVTGDTGFKGSWLALWLRELGAEVHGLALPPLPGPTHYAALRLGERIRHRDGDIREEGVVREAFGAAKPEVVFHLAAQAIVRESYDDPKGTFDTNVGGTVNVLEAARGCPSLRAIVVVTSDKCYENREWEFAYRENDPLGGRDPYAASKAAAELAVGAYRASFFLAGGRQVGAASARAGNVIGGGDWAKDRLLPDCVRALTAGKAVLIRNPKSIRPWQHVLEPLAGYLQLGQRLLDDPARFSAAFNFGPMGPDTLPVLELAEMFLAGWGGGKLDVAQGSEGQPYEATLLRLSSKKAASTLGFRPLLEAREAVRWTVEWYRRWHEAGAGADLLDLSRGQIARYVEAGRKAGVPWAVVAP